jgi:hypothetical protein
MRASAVSLVAQVRKWHTHHCTRIFEVRFLL